MAMGVHLSKRNAVALLIMFLSCSLSQAQSQRTMQLDLPSLDGTTFIRLDQFSGRPMVLNFWSSDCPPCIAELPMLFKEALRYPRAQFLGIAVENRSSASRFLDGQKVTYPQVVAMASPEGIMRRFGNPKGGLPHTVVLSKSHQICQVKTGMIEAAWIRSAVAQCST
jgi:thiol-disulfide isomerase/thioredoxin